MQSLQNPTDVPYNGAGFHAPTLPANTTIAPNGYLLLANHNKSTGYTFNIQTCNISTSTLSFTACVSLFSHLLPHPPS